MFRLRSFIAAVLCLCRVFHVSDTSILWRRLEGEGVGEGGCRCSVHVGVGRKGDPVMGEGRVCAEGKRGASGGTWYLLLPTRRRLTAVLDLFRGRNEKLHA